MTNEELLEKIGKVVEQKLEAERKHTGELIDQKLEPIKADLDTLKKDVHELTADMSDFFHKTWEKMDETNARVTIIEDQLEIPHPKEN